MKTKNSIKNLISSMFSNILIILISFIAQKYFLKFLGTEYLGLNSLFKNIISMLNIVELGLGSAIIYNLYKPLAEENHKKISVLMRFYKNAYLYIAFIILIIGIIVALFLNHFIGELTVNTNIYIIYTLFLGDSILSYILSYKRSILYADQKNYIINNIHVVILFLLNIIQIYFLYITKNYYIYLVLKILFQIVENLIIIFIVNKKYDYLKFTNEKLDSKTEKDIFKKIKALFVHKIGGFIVQGTDNIIISKYLGIGIVGLYSNYYLIINSVQNLFIQGLKSIIPSVGDMLTENNKEKNFSIFKKIRFLNFWIATISSICILIIINSFITIWLGKEFLLSIHIIIVLVLNYFQNLMRTTYNVFKEAAGIYHEDRFVPLIESAVNIIASLILLKYFGLAGVFMGTIISSFALWCYSYPKYVYKGLFNKSYSAYAKETLGYIMTFIIIATITFGLSSFLTFSNIYIQFINKILLALIVPNLILIIIFHKTDNFKYYKTLIKDIIYKKK